LGRFLLLSSERGEGGRESGREERECELWVVGGLP
jgi:hypothetical protein